MFWCAITLGEDADIDFNIVSSVFGKGKDNIVEWINKGYATYINKEKALNYLHHSAPIAEALSDSRLSSAAKVVENFETSKGTVHEIFQKKTRHRLEGAGRGEWQGKIDGR